MVVGTYRYSIKWSITERNWRQWVYIGVSRGFFAVSILSESFFLLPILFLFLFRSYSFDLFLVSFDPNKSIVKFAAKRNAIKSSATTTTIVNELAHLSTFREFCSGDPTPVHRQHRVYWKNLNNGLSPRRRFRFLPFQEPLWSSR